MADTKKERKKIRSEEELSKTDRIAIDNVCHKCNFYHKEQEYYEEEFECAAYELIRFLLNAKRISVDQINDLFTRIDLNPERQLKSGY